MLRAVVLSDSPYYILELTLDFVCPYLPMLSRKFPAKAVDNGIY